MTIRQIAPAALWILACALAGATYRAGAMSTRITPAPIATVSPAPGVPAVPDRELLQQHADSLRQRNPFRLERSPTAQPFGAPEAAEAPPGPVEPEAPQRPLPSVGGIVGGPPWKALIEGLPGHEAGVLLTVGEEWNGFRVRWVRRDSVMLVTPDTTLILALKQAWR
jgi:hypothetical protein